MNNLTHKAYLTMIVDAKSRQLEEVRIFSSSPSHATQRLDKLYGCIFETEGSSFQEAHDKMIEVLQKHPAWKWMFEEFFDTSDQAIRKKLEAILRK